MAVLVRQKQYDWKDSNLALFGSDVEREVKRDITCVRSSDTSLEISFLQWTLHNALTSSKESAEAEPAWHTAGQEVGVQVWRIVKFQVTEWPEEDFGKFYNGDSYIVLNTYTEEGSDRFLYDVHFWIGKYSTQDEYGTAAYKTVELDTYLDDVPVQHREVQGFESDLFKSYFDTITIMEGGADSGFKQVTPEQYEPRFFHFHGNKKNVEVQQIPRCRSRLDPNDVYILDLGLTIYQWNGSGANVQEKTKAMQYVQGLVDERPGRAVMKEVLDEHSTSLSHEFYGFLNEEDEEDTACDYSATNKDTELYRLSDESGELVLTKEKEGVVSKSDFDGKDVFILDTKKELFVWIGSETTHAERKNAMTYAHRYLQKCDHPFLPISCFSEGKTTKEFEAALAA